LNTKVTGLNAKLIYSFILYVDLYSASSRLLLRSGPDSRTAKKNSFILDQSASLPSRKEHYIRPELVFLAREYTWGVPRSIRPCMEIRWQYVTFYCDHVSSIATKAYYIHACKRINQSWVRIDYGQTVSSFSITHP